MARRNRKPSQLTPAVTDLLRVPARRDITLPERVAQNLGSEYPGFWKLVELVRSHPEVCRLDRWQPWCYLPINVASGALIALTEGEYESALEAEIRLQRDTCLGAALAAWRMTKGVYSFDPTVLRALFESDLKDGLPEECFLRLPEWCVYIPTPGIDYMPGLPMHGFFAYVDDHAAGGRDFPPQLNFEILLDPKGAKPEMLAVLCACLGNEADRDSEYVHWHACVDLGAGSFARSMRERLDILMEETLPIAAAAVLDTPEQQRFEDLLATPAELQTKILANMVSTNLRLANVVLYLCSDEADITPNGLGNRREAVRLIERSRKRTYMSPLISEWNVGWRIGADLRLSTEAAADGACDSSGTGTAPRPHIRRAHWHTFWTGSRSGQQERRVKWLPPIPVNVKSSEQLVATQRNVTEDTQRAK